jgi:adenylate cyclase
MLAEHRGRGVGDNPQSMSRRVVAIAFADVVGYSILTAADEVGTHERWMALFERSVRPEATRLGGCIMDLRGDGVLAEFPDASAALTWARALHAASAAEANAESIRSPIVLRIAIHVGSVLSSEHGLFGDAVNLAARLQEYGTPGGIVLSADAMAALRGDLGALARDLGALPLRNMSRTVRAFVLDAPGGAVPVPLPPPPARLPSVAILPLTNLTGDSADDYLAEGMVADVIASLAGLHEVFVIAQDSARVFRAHRPDPRRIGHILGVRFVVTGQLRRAGRGMRVSIELLDSETGETLWGDRFDMTAKDIFDVQDRVVGEIVGGIAPNLRAAALRDAMRKHPENLTAYDLMLRGLHAMDALEPEGFGRALAHLEHAIAEDPGFALPLAWAARWHSLNIGYGWSANPAADNAAAITLGTRDRARPHKCFGAGHLRPPHRLPAARLRHCDGLLHAGFVSMPEQRAGLDSLQRHTELHRGRRGGGAPRGARSEAFPVRSPPLLTATFSVHCPLLQR